MKVDFKWWRDNLGIISGKPLWLSEPDIVFFSDALNSGWGALCGDETTRGPWPSSEQAWLINAKELQAAWYALRSFARKMTKKEWRSF